MKKVLSILFAAVMMISCLAVSASAQTIGMPNPFQSAKTMEDAGRIAGFSMTAPDSFQEYRTDVIEAVQNDMIQVIYHDSNRNELRIRKAKGLVNKLDGDYNEYDTSKCLWSRKTGLISTRGDYLLLGTQDTNADNYTIRVATWFHHGFTYSVTCDMGLSQQGLMNLTEQIG